jgi:hypothetical protein
LAAYNQRSDAKQYIKSEILQTISHLLNDTLEPTEFASFPEGILATDFTDPVTLDELQPGIIYGFLVEGQCWYLANSLETTNTFIDSRFRGSSRTKVFVPFKNSLVDTNKIKWILAKKRIMEAACTSSGW